eukprot:3699539-Pleurochrysis_carterae.AAC.3
MHKESATLHSALSVLAEQSRLSLSGLEARLPTLLPTKPAHAIAQLIDTLRPLADAHGKVPLAALEPPRSAEPLKGASDDGDGDGADVGGEDKGGAELKRGAGKSAVGKGVGVGDSDDIDFTTALQAQFVNAALDLRQDVIDAIARATRAPADAPLEEIEVELSLARECLWRVDAAMPVRRRLRSCDARLATWWLGLRFRWTR